MLNNLAKTRWIALLSLGGLLFGIIGGIVWWQNYKQKQNQPPEEIATQTFDMTKVEQSSCNPCSGDCREASPEVVEQVTNFYKALKNNDAKSAIAIISADEESYIPSYLFPLCSSLHEFIAFKPVNGGIVVFTFQGNGPPSVPNKNYFFGYIWVSGEKILLYEKVIKHYFDGELGEKYVNFLNTNDTDHAVEILNLLESKTKKGIETGFFENPAVQKEYEEFISGLGLD